MDHQQNISPTCTKSAWAVCSWLLILALATYLQFGCSVGRAQNLSYGNLTISSGYAGSISINSASVDSLTANSTGGSHNGWINTANAADAVYLGGNVSFATLGVTLDTVADGNCYIIGPNLAFGSYTLGYSPVNGAGLVFYDNGDNTSSNITFTAPSFQTQWIWQENGSINITNQALLDVNGNLTLRDPVNGNTLQLSPDGYGGGNISIQQPGSGALVADLADYPYYSEIGFGGVQLGAGYDSTLSLGGISMDGENFYDASGLDYISIYYGLNFSNGFSLVGDSTQPPFSYYEEYYYGEYYGLGFGIGENISADSPGAIAFGNEAFATGTGAFALSGGSASGFSSIAIGSNSTASASETMAVAGGNATGTDAIALGSNATASGDFSIALGTGTSAQVFGEVVVGRYNQTISGNSTTWQANDPAFVIGTGNSSVSANALVVYNSGNAAITGNFTVANPSYVSPTNSTQPQTMEINGASTFNGTVNFAGNVTLAEPQGDLLMGAFGE